jgi:hypothetical protein
VHLGTDKIISMEQYDRWWPTNARWRRAEEAIKRATARAYIELSRQEQSEPTAHHPVSYVDGRHIIDLTNVDLPSEPSENRLNTF